MSGNRSFLNRAYPIMKKHNPHTPILMREASGIEPRVFARYGTKTPDTLREISISKINKTNGLAGLITELGKETQEALSGMSASQIEERITNLVKQTS
ncbi:NADH-ubiquinone oxidoreductase 10.5 kDa subunit [Penicillium canariense]|uniref:NADH-ubiquinone oxidoreductase 10.5 kDa subunit n=1 Tax=Penicillium canariense TaxID=189055 RepID=A0A9W9LMS6_9EURO|nr:NADH-ubiquinone oxidoreductase 10.5 kDa subunit [Penicillium canariense]KAJ5166255.1 NADH-ubiquinone oxidoreductase 10.5 kDa subunit [Penicillium canariense]